MNNRAIADALGVSLNTVYRHIGKQPPELCDRGIRAKPVSQSQPEDDISACLAVVNRRVVLRGAHLAYDLDLKKRMLRIASEAEPGLELTFDELSDVINELRCIARKVETLQLENEMW